MPDLPGLLVGKISNDNLVRQFRGHSPQIVDHGSGSLRTNDRQWFGASTVGNGMQHSRQTGNVVGMPVREADCVETFEAPTGLLPRNLGSFTDVEHDDATVDSHQKT